MFRNTIALSFTFVLSLLIPFAMSQATSISSFPYKKNIIIPSGTSSEVMVTLDEEVMPRLKQDMSNIAIIDQNGGAVPYRYHQPRSGLINEAIPVLDISSQMEGDNPNFLSDNRGVTSFYFDESIDRQNPSWAIFDLGKNMLLRRLFTLPSLNVQGIFHVQVEGSADMENFIPLIKKRPFIQTLDIGNLKPTRYIKVSFWGNNIGIDSIQFFVSPTAELYFTAKAGNRYTLYYGNADKGKSYALESTDHRIPPTIARLSRQAHNRHFPADYDQDGVENKIDNCLLIENKNQRDSDGDQVGNECDNAPQKNNPLQFDSDGDSIGDIVDNCVFESNTNQKDADNDKIGDVCDPMTKSYMSLPSEFPITTVIISIVLALMGFAGGWVLISRVTKK